MNKAELIEYMARDTNLPKTICQEVLESFVKAIENTLKKNKNVILTGFGTFSVTKRKERMGINPATQKKIKIPAKRVPKFKAGKHFKEMVK